MLTSTSATARGRGANTSALPTCPPTVTIRWIFTPFIYSTCDIKGVVYFTLCTPHQEYFSSSWPTSLIVYSSCQKANFKNCKTAILLEVRVSALEQGLWVKAQNVGICLFCSLTAFLGDEAYLVTDRASECQTHPPTPPQHPDFHTSRKCLLGSAMHQSNTHPHSQMSPWHRFFL